MFGYGCFSDFCFKIWYVILCCIYVHSLFIIAYYCCASSLQGCQFFLSFFGSWNSTSPSWSLHLIAHLHPGRLTWNLIIHPWKRKNIFRSIIFRFYVNLRECMGSSWCISGCNHSSGGKVHKSPCTRCNDGFIWFGLRGCHVFTASVDWYVCTSTRWSFVDQLNGWWCIIKTQYPFHFWKCHHKQQEAWLSEIDELDKHQSFAVQLI